MAQDIDPKVRIIPSLASKAYIDGLVADLQSQIDGLSGGGGTTLQTFANTTSTGYDFYVGSDTTFDEHLGAVGAPSATLIATPLPCSRTCTFDKIACDIYSGVSGGTVRLGFYESDPDTSLPTNLLVDSGDLPADVANYGIATYTLPTPIDLTAGLIYWMTVMGNSSSVVLRQITRLSMPPIFGSRYIPTVPFQRTEPFVGIEVAASYGAFPGTFPTPVLVSSNSIGGPNFPWVGVHINS